MYFNIAYNSFKNKILQFWLLKEVFLMATSDARQKFVIEFPKIDLKSLRDRLFKKGVRIEAFGDSVMKGIMLDENKHFRSCANRFDIIRRDFDIEIVNNARIGFTIERGFAQIKKFVTKEDCPEFVLLEYGGNDCNFDWKAVSEHPDKEHLPVIAPERFAELYREVVRYLTKCGATPIIILPPPIDADKFLTWVCRDGLSRENILKWLGNTSMIYRWQEYYAQICENIARECGVYTLDLRSVFITRHDFDSLICEDGIHPTAKGHEIIDRRLHELLTEILSLDSQQYS